MRFYPWISPNTRLKSMVTLLRILTTQMEATDAFLKAFPAQTCSQTVMPPAPSKALRTAKKTVVTQIRKANLQMLQILGTRLMSRRHGHHTVGASLNSESLSRTEFNFKFRFKEASIWKRLKPSRSTLIAWHANVFTLMSIGCFM
jgi:hypothetical protein